MKHTRRMLAVGHRRRRRRQPAQGRPSRRLRRAASVPVFGSVAKAREATGADVIGASSSHRPSAKAAVVEAADAGIGLAVVITEGIPVHDAVAFRAYAQAARHPHHRPQLPGPDQPRPVQRGHHPRRHRTRARPHRPGLQVRHAHLPTHVRAAGHRLLLLRRHRRRPRHRHHPHRLPRRLRGRPRHRTDRAHRRDRRRRGGARGRVHQASTSPSPSSATSPGSPHPRAETMGHAGAIVSGSSGTARAKKEALEAAGVRVGDDPDGDGAACARPADVTFRISALRPVSRSETTRYCSVIEPGVAESTSWRDAESPTRRAAPDVRTDEPTTTSAPAPYCHESGEARWAPPQHPHTRLHPASSSSPARPGPTPGTAASTVGARGVPRRPRAQPVGRRLAGGRTVNRCPPQAPSTAAALAGPPRLDARHGPRSRRGLRSTSTAPGGTSRCRSAAPASPPRSTP